MDDYIRTTFHLPATYLPPIYHLSTTYLPHGLGHPAYAGISLASISRSRSSRSSHAQPGRPRILNPLSPCSRCWQPGHIPRRTRCRIREHNHSASPVDRRDVGTRIKWRKATSFLYRHTGAHLLDFTHLLTWRPGRCLLAAPVADSPSCALSLVGDGLRVRR